MELCSCEIYDQSKEKEEKQNSNHNVEIYEVI